MNDTPNAVRLLQKLTASTDDQHHCQLPGTDTEPESDLIAPLTHYGFIATRGLDSAAFLQGQTTCNISEIANDRSLQGAFCTPKGRVISSFRVGLIDGDTYLMRMRRDLMETTLRTLAKYIVFSKAEQYDAGSTFLPIGVRGSRAARNIRTVFGALPDGPDGALQHRAGFLNQLDNDGLTFEIWLKNDHIETLWPILSQGLQLQGSRTWELLTIRLGLAEVCAATSDQFIPQMLNFQATGAISFTKGCYTGQEVIARMQYKGTAKRRLYRVRIGGSPVLPSAPLFKANSEQSIGNVVNAVTLDDGNTEALAVITVGDTETNAVIGDESGHSVEILSLPYAIT